MMQSTFGGVGDEDDDFAPNPFRSGTASGGDLLGAPNNTATTGVTSSSNVMVHQPLNQPDPYSGMTGAMDIPISPTPPLGGAPPMPAAMQQQQQARSHDPTQWSGTMDQRAAPVEEYGSGGGPPGDIASTPFSIFSWRSWTACVRLDTYRQYFDVDTMTIGARLKASLTTFWQPDQFRTHILGDAPNSELGLKGPDLYGPVWIGMTLMFLIAVSSNVHAYWNHQKAQKKLADGGGETLDEEFEVDIHHLLRASTVVAAFVFGVATLLWLAATCMGMPAISWAMWVCCYGYSQVPYLLAALLIPLLPLELATWILLAVATAASGLLVLRNLSTPLLAQDAANHAKASPIILAILAIHAVYFFVLKFTFYP